MFEEAEDVGLLRVCYFQNPSYISNVIQLVALLAADVRVPVKRIQCFCDKTKISLEVD